MNFDVGEGEVIIFDEADEYIYGDTGVFVDFLGRHPCVCLTATSGGSEQEAAEKTILGHIGFKIFAYALLEAERDEPVRFEEVDLCDNEAIYQYLAS